MPFALPNHLPDMLSRITFADGHPRHGQIRHFEGHKLACITFAKGDPRHGAVVHFEDGEYGYARITFVEGHPNRDEIMHFEDDKHVRTTFVKGCPRYGEICHYEGGEHVRTTFADGHPRHGEIRHLDAGEPVRHTNNSTIIDGNETAAVDQSIRITGARCHALQPGMGNINLGCVVRPVKPGKSAIEMPIIQALFTWVRRIACPVQNKVLSNDAATMEDWFHTVFIGHYRAEPIKADAGILSAKLIQDAYDSTGEPCTLCNFELYLTISWNTDPNKLRQRKARTPKFRISGKGRSTQSLPLDYNLLVGEKCSKTIACTTTIRDPSFDHWMKTPPPPKPITLSSIRTSRCLNLSRSLTFNEAALKEVGHYRDSLSVAHDSAAPVPRLRIVVPPVATEKAAPPAATEYTALDEDAFFPEPVEGLSRSASLEPDVHVNSLPPEPPPATTAATTTVGERGMDVILDAIAIVEEACSSNSARVADIAEPQVQTVQHRVGLEGLRDGGGTGEADLVVEQHQSVQRRLCIICHGDLKEDLCIQLPCCDCVLHKYCAERALQVHQSNDRGSVCVNPHCLKPIRSLRRLEAKTAEEFLPPQTLDAPRESTRDTPKRCIRESTKLSTRASDSLMDSRKKQKTSVLGRKVLVRFAYTRRKPGYWYYGQVASVDGSLVNVTFKDGIASKREFNWGEMVNARIAMLASADDIRFFEATKHVCRRAHDMIAY